MTREKFRPWRGSGGEHGRTDLTGFQNRKAEVF